jgi:hypothetical protein
MHASHTSVALLGLLLFCSCQPPSKAGVSVASVESRIRAIPDPDSTKYEKGQSSKTWQNPFLIIRKDAVALLDVGNNEERLLKPVDVLNALAELPASAWPYGRIVAVAESNVSSDQDRLQVRRNRGIVAGTLESAHIFIHWVSAQ